MEYYSDLAPESDVEFEIRVPLQTNQRKTKTWFSDLLDLILDFLRFPLAAGIAGLVLYLLSHGLSLTYQTVFPAEVDLPNGWSVNGSSFQLPPIVKNDNFAATKSDVFNHTHGFPYQRELAGVQMLAAVNVDLPSRLRIDHIKMAQVLRGVAREDKKLREKLHVVIKDIRSSTEHAERELQFWFGQIDYLVNQSIIHDNGTKLDALQDKTISAELYDSRSGRALLFVTGKLGIEESFWFDCTIRKLVTEQAFRLDHGLEVLSNQTKVLWESAGGLQAAIEITFKVLKSHDDNKPAESAWYNILERPTPSLGLSVASSTAFHALLDDHVRSIKILVEARCVIPKILHRSEDLKEKLKEHVIEHYNNIFFDSQGFINGLCDGIEVLDDSKLFAAIMRDHRME